MQLASTVGRTLLFCRLNHATGSFEAATHSLIAQVTGLKSAKRVGAIERGSPASLHELRQIARAFRLDVEQLVELAAKTDQQRLPINP